MENEVVMKAAKKGKIYGNCLRCGKEQFIEINREKGTIENGKCNECGARALREYM